MHLPRKAYTSKSIKVHPTHRPLVIRCLLLDRLNQVRISINLKIRRNLAFSPTLSQPTSSTQDKLFPHTVWSHVRQIFLSVRWSSALNALSHLAYVLTMHDQCILDVDLGPWCESQKFTISSVGWYDVQYPGGISYWRHCG